MADSARPLVHDLGQTMAGAPSTSRALRTA
jgi:hypothetical protein